jgi:hypothetical protein
MTSSVTLPIFEGCSAQHGAGSGRRGCGTENLGLKSRIGIVLSSCPQPRGCYRCDAVITAKAKCLPDPSQSLVPSPSICLPVQMFGVGFCWLLLEENAVTVSLPACKMDCGGRNLI